MSGRPSEFSDAIADAICGHLASGRPLVRICKDEGMPHLSTVYRWMASNEQFREKYARARSDQADTLADEIIDIADDSSNDRIVVDHGDGVVEQRTDQEAIQRSRLRVDARKWYASKIAPKKYGERIETAHTGDVRISAVHRVLIDPAAAKNA